MKQAKKLLSLLLAVLMLTALSFKSHSKSSILKRC